MLRKLIIKSRINFTKYEIQTSFIIIIIATRLNNIIYIWYANGLYKFKDLEEQPLELLRIQSWIFLSSAQFLQRKWTKYFMKKLIRNIIMRNTKK